MRSLLILLIAMALAATVLWMHGGARPSLPKETQEAPVHAPAQPTPAVQTQPSKPANVHWFCFRGPLYGVSPWDNAPSHWDGPKGKSVIWKTQLKASGVSSPVLWGSRIFLTEGTDKHRSVVAFDVATGQELWRQEVHDMGKAEALPAVSDAGLALPTPVCDAEQVYALFGTGDLAAFTHDGKLKWHIFLKRPVIGYGFSSSPCLLGKLVCVQVDDHTSGRVLAVEAETGKTVWEVERSRGASWSSPLVVEDPDGKPNMVVNANGSLSAYNAEGEMVWDADGVSGEVTPSPAYWEKRLYPVHVGSRLLCLDLSKKASEPPKLWEHTGDLCDVGSPVIANGLLFMGKSSGQLICVDAKTGNEIWTNEGPGCYASLTTSGGRVYLIGRDGTMLVFAAERKYRHIATCPLGEGTDATPAFSDGRIYIRGRNHLWCFGEK